MINQSLVNFLFEIGHLKRIKHEGWRLLGIDNPESIADHSLRAAQIAFVLANLEKYPNPYEVCSMVVFHDVSECRVGDIHKVASRYVQSHEEAVIQDQMSQLGEIGMTILDLWQQVEHKSTVGGIIAKDADYLEQAITAKEYLEKGYKFAQDWINNVEKALKTKSAKRILSMVKRIDSNQWWQGLKKLS